MSPATDKNILYDPNWNSICLSEWQITSSSGGFALGPFNLEILRNQTTGLVGGSGSGKTLLIRSLFGLLPSGFEFSAKSKMLLVSDDGTALSFSPVKMKEPEWIAWRRFIFAYLPQDPIPSFNPVLKLQDQFNQIGSIYSSSTINFRSNLADIGLDEDYLKRYPHELSGGQAQRMAFALAEALDYRVLIADEPTASLDSKLVHTTANLLKSWSQQGAAALVSSHDWNFLMKICDRVYVLNEGQCIESGAANDVLVTPESDVARKMKEASLIGGITEVRASTHSVPRTSIECRGVSVTYKNRQRIVALDNIQLDASDTRFLGILGASGSGKSTLAKLVSGLLPAEQGKVLINGTEIDYKDPHRFDFLSRQVQYIAQDPFSAFSPRMRVGDAIYEILELHSTAEKKAQIRDMINFWMRKAGLHPSKLESLPGRLSGGERQRMAIIRALACSPGMLILDEVTASLDHLNRKAILDLIREICSEENMGYWIISHDPDVLNYMSDKILTIEMGRIVSIEEISVWRQKKHN